MKIVNLYSHLSKIYMTYGTKVKYILVILFNIMKVNKACSYQAPTRQKSNKVFINAILKAIRALYTIFQDS